MPLNRPKLSAIKDRIAAAINSNLPGADARLRNSLLNAIVTALAGESHALYGMQEFYFRQVFPDTAEDEFAKRWAQIWGVTQKAATKASGLVNTTGVNGSTIAASTQLSRSDGVLFETTALATISGGVASVPVRALVEGAAGDTAASSTLTFVSTPTGINSTVAVDVAGLTGGADIETIDSLVARLLDRIQTPPQGGSADDYVRWALEVPGVTRAWCYPLELGPGTVSVRFMMDDTYGNGIPLAGDVTAVQNYIDARRPVTADLTVVAPTAVVRNFTIDLGATDTTDIRAAVTAELTDFIRREAEPGGTLYLSRINEAISIATGEFDHILSVPAANVNYTTGQIASMGTITFI